MRSRATIFAAALVVRLSSLASGADETTVWKPDVPKVWDETALREWVTPLAGLNARPSHISQLEYYRLPVEDLRTYPVYYPGREPAGYWDMLQRVGPRPLIEPQKLKTKTEWIAAGRRVFEESDAPQLRTYDALLIAKVRSLDFYQQHNAQALPDGTMDILRWVPTKKGVALSTLNCSGCHVLHRSNGMAVIGAPRLAETSRTKRSKSRGLPATFLESANHVLSGAPPFFMGAAPLGAWLYQAYGAPWVKDDTGERLKTFQQDDYEAWVTADRYAGAITRWNGSLFYPAKIPDLIGIKDRKYIDHTATHLHRGIGDLMRYAAQVAYAEIADFGEHRMLTSGTKRVESRISDEALYALALYLYSLEPPPNPNKYGSKAGAGAKIFSREGCADCHVPPLYTSNKLTLAEGFVPPNDKPESLDALPISVGTDPGLALATRKGTGYYKIPSLRGVWYRGHYLHDGSAASLEEMFNPERLKPSYVPEGWLPPGEKTHPIKGHEFGLKLDSEEREQLLAFLRTL
jgi:hypothetical protein